MQWIMARGLLFIWGFYWIECVGERPKGESNGKRVVVVAAPHVALSDAMALASLGLPVSPIAASWIANIPLIGSLANSWQSLMVQRRGSKDPGAKLNAGGGGVVAQLEERVRRSDEGFFAPLVFPEGCTTNGESLIQFKSGAFVPKAPIQPCILRYPNCNFHPGWTTTSLVNNLFRMLCQVYNRIQVEVLEVVEPLEEEDPKAYARRVMEIMAKSSGIGIVPCDRSLQQKYLDLHGDETPIYAPCGGVNSGGGGSGRAKVAPSG